MPINSRQLQINEKEERCSHFFSFFCFFCFWDDFVFCETESENKPRQTANHVASFWFSIAEEKKKETKKEEEESSDIFSVRICQPQDRHRKHNTRQVVVVVVVVRGGGSSGK